MQSLIKITITICFALIAMLIFEATEISAAFKGIENQTVRNAQVQIEDEMFIFIKCTPVDQYKAMGTVKTGGLVVSAKAEDMIHTLIKKAKKDYPGMQGIIIDNLTFDHATVIQFENEK